MPTQIQPVAATTACTRFDLEIGRNQISGAPRAGLFILEEFTGRTVASWQAEAGALDSGWLGNLSITFSEVYVSAIFIPDDASPALNLEILNPAPNSPFGWLARGICHAIEIQFPAGY